MGKFIDMTGLRYGRLRVINYAGKDRNNLTEWLCECECGKKLIVRGQDLRRGRQVSCGCHKRNLTVERNTFHGLSKTRPYRIWKNMKSRCLNPKTKSYCDYGGRGITVCEKWVGSFDAFWEDMKDGYADCLELDRIDSNKGYSPENCRWVDKKTQNRNTRQNHYIEVENRLITIAEAAECAGVSYDKAKRLVYNGKLDELKNLIRSASV